MEPYFLEISQFFPWQFWHILCTLDMAIFVTFGLVFLVMSPIVWTIYWWVHRKDLPTLKDDTIQRFSSVILYRYVLVLGICGFTISMLTEIFMGRPWMFLLDMLLVIVYLFWMHKSNSQYQVGIAMWRSYAYLEKSEQGRKDLNRMETAWREAQLDLKAHMEKEKLKQA